MNMAFPRYIWKSTPRKHTPQGYFLETCLNQYKE